MRGCSSHRSPSGSSPSPQLPRPSAPAGSDGLTGRETEIFRLLADGLSNAEIAARLVIAESTVKSHITHVLSKPACATGCS